MKYVEFQSNILHELQRSPSGLTWKELRERLKLPYDRPCPTWVKQLERDIGLTRKRGTGRALVWTVG